MATPLDLAPFCGKKKYREYLMQPFSRGDYTYATNGHILVRVPRQDDAPEHPKAPAPEKLFEQIDDSLPLQAIPHYEIPEPTRTPCEFCDGRGFEHDCPDCGCKCEECGGSGNKAGLISVALGPALLAAPYVKLLQTLPDIKIAVGPDVDRPAHFTFEGGDGLLMPLRHQYSTHVAEPTS